MKKKFYNTPEKTFVIKFEYGTSHVTWNYLFQIDSLNRTLYLKDIFYVEKYKNQGELPQDTLVYLVKVKIDKETNNISTQKIDSLFNHLDKVKNKQEKWIIK